MPKGVYEHKRQPLAERFWKHVHKTPECWQWTGYCNRRRGDYGEIQTGGRGDGVEYAHRVSWILHHGPVPQNLYVLHRCDNPGCVRPDHLFLGSAADNTHDMMEKGRAKFPFQKLQKGESR